MTLACIGVGANLGEPLEQLRNARTALNAQTGITVIQASNIYRSAAIGPGEQNDYLNAVLLVETSLDAHKLLDVLLALEDRAGRLRGERWGARVLDLDLLLMGTETHSCQRLQVPHPRVYERNFVLEPLAELYADDWCFPDGSALHSRRRDCQYNPLERTALSWETQTNTDTTPRQWA